MPVHAAERSWPTGQRRVSVANYPCRLAQPERRIKKGVNRRCAPFWGIAPHKQVCTGADLFVVLRLKICLWFLPRTGHVDRLPLSRFATNLIRRPRQKSYICHETLLRTAARMAFGDCRANLPTPW